MHAAELHIESDPPGLLARLPSRDLALTEVRDDPDGAGIRLGFSDGYTGWYARERLGELMMFDNSRVLHGRTAYDPAEGMRHLQGCYIDFDGPRSLYRTHTPGVRAHAEPEE